MYQGPNIQPDKGEV